LKHPTNAVQDYESKPAQANRISTRFGFSGFETGARFCPATASRLAGDQKKHLEETQSANERCAIVLSMSLERPGFGKMTRPALGPPGASATRLPYGDFQHLGSRFAALAAALEKDERNRAELRAALRRHFSSPAVLESTFRQRPVGRSAQQQINS
jgi:hypothetical protein